MCFENFLIYIYIYKQLLILILISYSNKFSNKRNELRLKTTNKEQFFFLNQAVSYNNKKEDIQIKSKLFKDFLEKICYDYHIHCCKEVQITETKCNKPFVGRLTSE